MSSRNGRAGGVLAPAPAIASAPPSPLADKLAGEIIALDALIAKHSLSALAELGHVERAFMLAEGMMQLRQAITPAMMAPLMQLQNTRLGFRTDRPPKIERGKIVDPGGYPPETVKECAIEVLLRGAYLVGNEFNIIAGGPYLTKEYFARMVSSFPGLTDLKTTPGVPIFKPSMGGALVAYRATWLLNGNAMSLEREIPIRVNEGQGADAILGKATRKMLAAVWGRLTGSEHTVPDGEVDVIDGEAIPSLAPHAPGIDDLPSIEVDAQDVTPAPAAAQEPQAPAAEASPPPGSIAEALRRAKERAAKPNA